MLLKYPRTPHLQGSRLQPGDTDLVATPFGQIAGRYLVVEEKLDGANCALSFGSDGRLRLQSRGHYLTGGPRERQFAPLKSWAATVAPQLWPKLKDRFVMYGEWLYAKHTVYYDALPHYFFEFDVYDRQQQVFLSTKRRRELLGDAPVRSVPVLASGPMTRLADLVALLGPSAYRTSNWRQALKADAADNGVDPERAIAETDTSKDMEGLYIKVEQDGQTVARYKWVRASFLTSVLDSGSHWHDRPIIPNRLVDPGVLYGNV